MGVLRNNSKTFSVLAEHKPINKSEYGWTFTIGFATMLNTGILPPMSEAQVVEKMSEIGTALFSQFVSPS